MPGVIVGNGGHRTWSMTRDDDGHRNYTIVFRVQVLTPGRDGPWQALFNTPNLPVPGDPWVHDNETDLWAHCKKRVDVRPVQSDNQLISQFDLTFYFSTRPDVECQDTQVEDPLLEPQKISGGSVRYNEEATFDRFGRPLLTSSFEQLRGPQVEFDWNRDQIRVSQNVPFLQHTLCTSMRDHVNAYTLWGYPRRCIKLSDFQFERVFRGKCQVYYKRHFVFDISYRLNPTTGLIESGFDRDILDHGTKCLSGKHNNTTGLWEAVNVGGAAPNPNNPMHFIRYSGRDGNVCNVVLNGAGLPAGVVTQGTGMFISIVNGNVGQSLANQTKWLPLFSETYAPWDSDLRYAMGQLVSYAVIGGPTEIYLALVHGAITNAPPNDPTFWLHLPSGASDLGSYNAGTTYAKGQYVDDSQATSAAMIHVERYNEADFLLLNVPILF